VPLIPPFPNGETLTVRTPVIIGYSDLGVAEFDTEETDVDGCAFQPTQTSELNQGSDQVISDANAFFPAGTAVDPAATVVRKLTGIEYEVQGANQAHVSPFTQNAAPIRVRLRAVTGVAGHVGSGAV